MTTYSIPDLPPDNPTGLKFAGPNHSTRFAGPNASWLIADSKKVDDLSRHESDHDPKKDPKVEPTSKHPDVVHPGVNHRDGTKPRQGGPRKS